MPLSWPYKPPGCQCGEILTGLEEIREAIAAQCRQITELIRTVNRDSAAVGAQLVTIDRKAGKIMSQQDDLNAQSAQIETDVQAISDGVTAIQAEIAQLQAANPALDLSGLQQAVADLGTATAGVTAAGSEVPPPSA